MILCQYTMLLQFQKDKGSLPLVKRFLDGILPLSRV